MNSRNAFKKGARVLKERLYDFVLRNYQPPSNWEMTQRSPVINWRNMRKYHSADFPNLLRSDELPRGEMLRFRKDIGVVSLDVGTDWDARDQAISEARAAQGLPVVSRDADKRSQWVKAHQATLTPRQPI